MRVGWGQIFLFFNKNFLYLLLVLLVGLRGLVWGFGAGRGGLLCGEVGGWLVGCIRSGDGSHGLFSVQMLLVSSSLSLIFCLARMPCLVLEPWIGLGSRGEGLGVGLRIFLMLCHNIKFQNFK